MWSMIPSWSLILQHLAGAFTTPSFVTCSQLLLGWVMCLGTHKIRTVAFNIHPEWVPDYSQRHNLDRYYNFFSRSAWSVSQLARHVVSLILTTFRLCGTMTLIVDDTLAHKRGRCVWGLGWFRDAVASTEKRTATASGHNWVVVGVALCFPLTRCPVLAFPISARLHQSGQGHKSLAELAIEMLTEIASWAPDVAITLVADGAYACEHVVENLPETVTLVSRMRCDAAVYNPFVAPKPKGKRGPKAKKGKRLASPKKAAEQADQSVDFAWKWICVVLYRVERELHVFSYDVLWWKVGKERKLKAVVVRDPSGQMRDVYLFTTDIHASERWVVFQYSLRWSIEVALEASKQILEIESPGHYCHESVQKFAPWVWLMQSVIMVWYMSMGRTLPEALDWANRLGPWDSPWSLRHMIRVLREVILNATFKPTSANEPKLIEMVQTLKKNGRI